jgi:hypothetical protein
MKAARGSRRRVLRVAVLLGNNGWLVSTEPAKEVTSSGLGKKSVGSKEQLSRQLHGPPVF